MDFSTIRIIAKHEFIINVRNKWTLLFAVIFALLVLGISYFGMVTAGVTGFQGFVRTSASMLNLVLYLVPLVSLTMGTLSFTGDQGSTELLFSQPVTRQEILLGKLGGLFAAMATATLIGFGLAGLIVSANTGSEGATRYPLFIAFALALALIFLVLSTLIAMLCRRKAKAFGVTLFVWFFFVLFYDLLVIGGTFLLKERSANQFLFLALFANPVDLVRVGSLMVLDGKDIFGAAGASFVKFFGGQAASMWLIVAGLGIWTALPLYMSARLLKQQDL